MFIIFDSKNFEFINKSQQLKQIQIELEECHWYKSSSKDTNKYKVYACVGAIKNVKHRWN